MSKETVLTRVEADLRREDLGMARDRLHTLLHTYPNDVALRARLAEVYHQLQFPAMAGRYWYLEEHQTPDMRSAVAAFELSCGGDPLLTLSALKFRGDPQRLPDYAKERLESLRHSVQEKYEFFPEADARSRMLRGGRGATSKQVRETASRQMLRRTSPRRGLIQHRSIAIGHSQIDVRVALAVALIMALAATGLVNIAWWLYAAIQ